LVKEYPSVNKKLTLFILLLLAVGFFAGISYGCVFRNTFGIICPSCGISRAWLAVFRGQLKSAIRLHPMFWFPPAVLFYCCRTKPLISKKADWWIIALLGATYFTLYLIKLI